MKGSKKVSKRTINDLKYFQNMPLDVKMREAIEWINEHGNMEIKT